jgi:tetratricopeptide (TPR) repeat protein
LIPRPRSTLLAVAASLVVVGARVAAPAATPEAAADPATSFHRGLLAMAQGDPEAALDLLERAVRAEPENLHYGAEYRQAAIAAEAYDRSIDFFALLAQEHPDLHVVFLNWGYAYVDKIPAAGAITQVILSDRALGRFTAALDRQETWLGLYTRGHSYIYWPAIFGRTLPGIADLERAIAVAEDLQPRAHHAYAWRALGDGHWRLDDLERARQIWRQGSARFPGDPGLEARLQPATDEELEALLQGEYEIGRRVATDLRELVPEEAAE